MYSVHIHVRTVLYCVHSTCTCIADAPCMQACTSSLCGWPRLALADRPGLADQITSAPVLCLIRKRSAHSLPTTVLSIYLIHHKMVVYFLFIPCGGASQKSLQGISDVQLVPWVREKLKQFFIVFSWFGWQIEVKLSQVCFFIYTFNHTKFEFFPNTFTNGAYTL